MRKGLLLTLATFVIVALTLVSCSNDEILDSPETQNSEGAIEFRTLTDKQPSNGLRAAITDETNILSFTLAGIKMKSGSPTADPYLFNGFDITKGESGSWDYTPKRYWPKDLTVDFYAYSPASSTNVKKGANEGLTNFVSTRKITYTVPTIKTNDAQEDFLVARAIGQDGTAGKGENSVKLQFEHALSRVMFFARTTQKSVTYTIDKIELVNLYGTGKIDLTSNTWTPEGTKNTNYTVDMGSSPAYLLNDYASVLGITNAVMVLPQQTVLGAKDDGSDKNFYIKVSYKAFVDDQYYVGTKDKSEDKYFAVKGTDGNALKFEMGTQYNFYLEFGDEVGKEINFTVDVSDWTNAPNTYLPEIADYKGLISPELQKYAGLDSKTSIKLEDIKTITTLTISITENDQTPDLTGIEYLPLTEIIICTGTDPGSSSNTARTCPKLDFSMCQPTLKNIRLRYSVTVTELIIPFHFQKGQASIGTGEGHYGTCKYPDGTSW